MHIFISDSKLHTECGDINSHKKKKHESNRNKYYKSLWIKYTSRMITNKRSMPKIKTSREIKIFKVFIKMIANLTT